MNTLAPPGVPARPRTTLDEDRDRGFTLIEVLIAIVLVAILAAVAVVGIGRLTDRASAATCAASADAARVASTSYHASHQASPTSFGDLVSSTSGGGAALVVPNGASVAGSTMSGDGWTLTMVAGVPPTFSCAPGTTSLGNGVSVVTASVAAQLVLTLTNSADVTAMTGTFSTRQTAGVTFSGVSSNLWGGTVSVSSSRVGGFLVYTFTLLPGQTIVAGTWKLDGQWTGPGSLNLLPGDTWSITTTSQGRTNTATGTF